MFEVTNYKNSSNNKSSVVNYFLAVVQKVYLSDSDFLEFEKEGNIKDFLPIYNNNENIGDKDVSYYGAIDFRYPDYISDDSQLIHAFPFDKNNFTFPILGETVLILQIGTVFHYLPYTRTLYPNYREDIKITQRNSDSSVEENSSQNKSKDYQQKKKTGISTTTNSSQKDKPSEYKINEKIKFLKARNGDTILSGRVGNTIRFSEFFLTEDDKTSSAGIFIRNKQNPELDSKKIGELVDEDINKDGTSIYITSNKIKVPFKETIQKTKIGFKDYPSSNDLKGDQLFINSDRIVLSAKAKEFIIYGKGNTGVITDGNYSIDAEKEIYVHNKKNITIHSEGANEIFLNSDNGKVFLGKNKGEGDAGASVQKMVLGGELVKVLEDLIDAITQQFYLTPSGPTKVGPENIASFSQIKSQLKTILSAKNFLSKN